MPRAVMDGGDAARAGRQPAHILANGTARMPHLRAIPPPSTSSSTADVCARTHYHQPTELQGARRCYPQLACATDCGAAQSQRRACAAPRPHASNVGPT